jgi:hypothetical protein
MGAIALNELIFLFSGPPYREMMYRPSPGRLCSMQEPGQIPADDCGHRAAESSAGHDR